MRKTLKRTFIRPRTGSITVCCILHLRIAWLYTSSASFKASFKIFWNSSPWRRCGWIRLVAPMRNDCCNGVNSAESTALFNWLKYWRSFIRPKMWPEVLVQNHNPNQKRLKPDENPRKKLLPIWLKLIRIRWSLWNYKTFNFCSNSRYESYPITHSLWLTDYES